MANSEHKATTDEKEVLEKYLLQFLNLEKRFPLLPGIENTQALAQLVGLEKDEFEKLRETYRNNAKGAAEELLEDQQVTGWIDQLPFEDGDTIVALGDSITDDLQGWLSILEHVLSITVPEANFTFVNSGVSYETSSEALQRFNRDVIDHDPDWVIVALGTFDMQRLHIAPDRTLVSLADFWENTNTIEQNVGDITDNPVIWLTPPPVITEMMQKMRFFDYDIFEDDLQNIREILAGKVGYIVDPLGQRMTDEGDQPDAWNYLSDGVHPSISGHVNTVSALLKNLAESEPQEGASLDSHREISDN
jgi:lysophospholipase L1-like esterase